MAPSIDAHSPSWGLDLPELFFDGATPVDENIGAYGWVFREQGQVSAKGSGAFSRSNGDLTSHYAEFVGVVKGLHHLLEMGYDRVLIKGDNLQVIRSLQNPTHWDDQRIQNGADLARELFHRFPSQTRAEKIPREQNINADALANGALQVAKYNDQTSETDPLFSISQDLSHPSSKLKV